MKKVSNPINVFFVLALIGLAVQFIILYVTGGSFLDEIIWDGRNGLFADFGSHVMRMMDGQPYDINDWDARFPPLAYLLYGIVARFLINTDYEKWLLLYMIMFLLVSLCIWFSVIYEYKLFSTYKNFLFCFFLLLSHPYLWAAFKAANSALYVLVILMAAMLLRESDNKICRELALILIAIAAGLKISPAIFGLLYIKEKRYKEASRLIIYGVLFFTVPFFFLGGFESLKIYLTILGQVSNFEGPRPETIIGVFIEIALLLGKSAHEGLIAGRIVSYIYLAFTIFNLFKNKLTWKSIALLTSSMVVVVNLCYPYTLIYFTIPLLIFFQYLKTAESYQKMDYFYAILFALIYITYPFLKIDWPTATFITNYFWVYILLGSLVIDQIGLMIYKRTYNNRSVKGKRTLVSKK